MSEIIDPLIQREFDRLGFGILNNENLAEMVIVKVTQRRRARLLKTIAISIGLVMLTGLAAVIVVKVTRSSTPTALTPSGASLTSNGNQQDSLPLPQFVVANVDATNPSGSLYSFTFDLTQGQLLEMVYEIPASGVELTGKIEVYEIQSSGPKTHVTDFALGSGTHINDFGIPKDGRYQIIYRLAQSTFKGRIRWMFMQNSPPPA